MASDAFDALTPELREEIYREILEGGVAFTRVFMQDMSAFIVAGDRPPEVIQWSRCEDPTRWDVPELPTIRIEDVDFVMPKPERDREIEAAGFEYVDRLAMDTSDTTWRWARVWKLKEGGEHLDAIKTLFKPGYKLTLLCRNPEHPDGSQDMVLTDDTISEAIAALEQRRPEKEKH